MVGPTPLNSIRNNSENASEPLSWSRSCTGIADQLILEIRSDLTRETAGKTFDAEAYDN